MVTFSLVQLFLSTPIFETKVENKCNIVHDSADALDVTVMMPS